MVLKRVSALSSEIFFKIEVIDGNVVLVFSILSTLDYIPGSIKGLQAKEIL
jgi:hypothetical protein